MNAAAILVHLLVAEPERQDRLRAEPGLAPRYVEEMLRLHTPVQNFARRTTCPVEVAGTTIPAGDGARAHHPARDPRPAPAAAVGRRGHLERAAGAATTSARPASRWPSRPPRDHACGRIALYAIEDPDRSRRLRHPHNR